MATTTGKIVATEVSDSTRIEVTVGMYSEEFRIFMRTLPGARWDKKKRVWRCMFTPFTCWKIVDSNYFDQISPSIAAAAADWQSSAGPHDGDDFPYQTDLEPWQHQRDAYNFAFRKSAVIFPIKMGGGKTKLTLDLVYNRGCYRVLIVCPKAVVHVWPGEVEKHVRGKFRVCPANPKHTTKRKAKAFREAHAIDEPTIFVVNYESVWRGEVGEFISSIHWDSIVCDESHFIAAANTKQSDFMSSMTPRSDLRICLSGTPMRNTPLDVYGQFRFLEPAIFGTSFSRFRSAFAVTNPMYPSAVVSLKNQDTLRQAYLMLAFECDPDLHLPEFTDTDIPIELGKEAQAIYDKLESEFSAMIGGEEIVVANVLVKLLKLQQITSGFISRDKSELATVDEDGELAPIDDSAPKNLILDSTKRDALVELLNEMPPNERVVVFCRFRHDLDVIKDAAEMSDRPFNELSGRINTLDVWKNSQSEGAVLAVQIQAGSTGIDLTIAQYCVFMSVGHSLSDYLQARARLVRPGQERPVSFYHLIARDTVDVKIRKAFERKEEAIAYIMRGE